MLTEVNMQSTQIYICENLKDFFLVEWKRIARCPLHWKVKALHVQVLCLSAFFSLLKEEEHSSALLWFVSVSSLSGNPSHLASGQNQQLATLLIVFVFLLTSSQIWFQNYFIHRFHVKIFATATVLIKCHSQLFFPLERTSNTYKSYFALFLFKSSCILWEKENVRNSSL